MVPTNEVSPQYCFLCSQELEEEARDINTTATSGKFLDPTQDATEILTELKEVFAEHQNVAMATTSWYFSFKILYKTKQNFRIFF